MGVVVLVEDSPTDRALFRAILSRGGFTVHEVLYGRDVLPQLEAVRPLALVLDVNLPDGDGRDYCAQLRRQRHTMPIIMLTGTAEETDVIRGLHAGAHDYISKPFRVKELLARIYAQLRLFDNSVDAVFTIGSYTFRPSAKLLANPEKKQRIRLTNKEVALLKFLHQTSNRIVLRQTLLDEVWGYNAGVTTHTLETHIYRLRQKMETDPTACRLLISMPGGYQLNAVG